MEQRLPEIGRERLHSVESAYGVGPVSFDVVVHRYTGDVDRPSVTCLLEVPPELPDETLVRLVQFDVHGAAALSISMALVIIVVIIVLEKPGEGFWAWARSKAEL